MRCASESDHETSAIPHLLLIHRRSVPKVGPLSQATISSIIIMFCVESITGFHSRLGFKRSLFHQTLSWHLIQYFNKYLFLNNVLLYCMYCFWKNYRPAKFLFDMIQIFYLCTYLLVGYG